MVFAILGVAAPHMGRRLVHLIAGAFVGLMAAGLLPVIKGALILQRPTQALLARPEDAII